MALLFAIQFLCLSIRRNLRAVRKHDGNAAVRGRPSPDLGGKSCVH